MTGIRQLTPILYGSFGAAAGYYGLPLFQNHTGRLVWLLAVLAGLIIVISLIWVLSQSPAGFVQDSGISYWFLKTRVCLFALSAGFSLGTAAGISHPTWFGLPESEVIGIYGKLLDDPRSFYNKQGMGNLTLQRVSGMRGTIASAQGTIRVFFPEEAIPRLKEFGRGSEVYIEGFLRLPDVSRNNSKAQTMLFYARAVYIVRPAPVLEQFRTGVRIQIIKQFSDPVWGGLALALLLGVTDNLDTKLSKAFLYAGCSHVLSLSGMHLAIVAAVIAFFLKKPLGLKAAAILGAVFIVLYVYLVGDLPSLTRSAIMYLLGTLVVLKRLPKQPASLLGMAFLIQILIQPESGYNISFILSYLALGGILFIGETFHESIRGLLPEIIAQPLAASVGAFIATAAVVTMFFETLRPVGIIAGLVIVPLTTFFMVGAMAALAVNMLLPFPASPLGLILSILYNVLECLTGLSALVPGMTMHPFVVLVLSLGLWGLFIFLNQRHILWRRNLAPFD